MIELKLKQDLNAFIDKVLENLHSKYVHIS